MKIAVGIPLYVTTPAHLRFLNQTTKSIYTTHEWIFIPVINRYTLERKPWKFIQKPNGTKRFIGRQPQAVSKAWNDIIVKSIEEKCDYTLILNADIILDIKAIDTLIAYAETNKNDNIMWTMTEQGLSELSHLHEGGHYVSHSNLASFMIDKTFSKIIGKFDENIAPAYFEDNDIFARIVKSGKHIAICPEAKFFHYGSTTINNDPDYLAGHHVRFRKNEAYFRSKWGHEPVWTEKEVLDLYYKTPFNDPKKDVNS